VAPRAPSTTEIEVVLSDRIEDVDEILAAMKDQGEVPTSARAEAVTVVSRLRKDAALRTLPATVRRKGQRGPLPTYGSARIELAKRAGQSRGWQAVRCVQYGHAVTKTIKTFLATWVPPGGVIRVVLLQEDSILLARHLRPGCQYWVLPGGAVEPDETPEEAAVREVREETGLEIEIERLLFVDGPRCEGVVVIKRPRYTYLGRIVGGELRRVEDRTGGHAEKGHLTGAEWMPWECVGYDAATNDTLRLVRNALECA